MAKVRDLFRAAETTEFVIVTIPTVIDLLIWLFLILIHLKIFYELTLIFRSF